MLIQKRMPLGDAADGGDFWDTIGKTVTNVVTGVTQYQLNKQAITAGNAGASNYVAPGTQPVIVSGPSMGLSTPLLLGGAGILLAVLLFKRKGR